MNATADDLRISSPSPGFHRQKKMKKWKQAQAQDCFIIVSSVHSAINTWSALHDRGNVPRMKRTAYLAPPTFWLWVQVFTKLLRVIPRHFYYWSLTCVDPKPPALGRHVKGWERNEKLQWTLISNLFTCYGLAHKYYQWQKMPNREDSGSGSCMP
jgi:hypothetical protein